MSKPMFQQRHFQAIAYAMQQVHPGMGLPVDNRAVTQWWATVKELTDLFAANNGQFDRDRFERACVPGANVRARS